MHQCAAVIYYFISRCYVVAVYNQWYPLYYSIVWYPLHISYYIAVANSIPPNRFKIKAVNLTPTQHDYVNKRCVYAIIAILHNVCYNYCHYSVHYYVLCNVFYYNYLSLYCTGKHQFTCVSRRVSKMTSAMNMPLLIRFIGTLLLGGGKKEEESVEYGRRTRLQCCNFQSDWHLQHCMDMSLQNKRSHFLISINCFIKRINMICDISGTNKKCCLLCFRQHCSKLNNNKTKKTIYFRN